MLTLTQINNNKEDIIKLLKIKNFEAEKIIEQTIQLDKDRKETKKQLDQKLAEQKIIAGQIGKMFKEGKHTEANAAKEKTGILKQESKELQNKFNEFEGKLNELSANVWLQTSVSQQTI